MVGPAEIARRARGRVTGRLESLPILALSVHSACNCRCVMCDIWKANSEKREISSDDLSRHVEAIRALRVQRVMLTGGEPLLHRNLWALCNELQALRIRVTLVTTGMLLEQHAAEVASHIDTVVISLDGPRHVHDAIRRVKGGFDRIAKGVMALRAQEPAPRLIARTVVQRDNAAAIDAVITAAHRMGFDEISFLAADVSSPAFNRPEPWSAGRIAEIAVAESTLAELELSIDRAVAAGTGDVRRRLRGRRARLGRSHRAVLPGAGGRRRVSRRAMQCALGVSGPRARQCVEAVLLSTRLCVFSRGPRISPQLRDRHRVSP